jgi:hypothetical protein
MSLLIHRENQEILWNVLQSHARMMEFDRRFPGQKETWFRTSLGHFYDSLPKSTTQTKETATQLLEKNKQAMEFLLADLGNRLGITKPGPPGSVSPTSPFAMPMDPLARGYEPYEVNKEKQRKEQEKIANYSNYQTQYNSLFQRETPKTVDFSEPINDGKIENMDSLIRQQQVMRDQDIARFAPPAPVPTPDEIKHKIQGIAAMGASDADVASARFSNVATPEIVIQPPSSAEWGSYTTDEQNHYETYRR